MTLLLRNSRGVTLIEMLVAIIVISIAAGGVMGLFVDITRHSADPMIQHQAVAIAESYLEEITGKAFADPDGADGESSRDQYDDVDDYLNLPDTVVRDQFGNAIAAQAGYAVIVAIANVNLGAPAEPAWRVAVTVTFPNEVNLTLVGYRTQY